MSSGISIPVHKDPISRTGNNEERKAMDVKMKLSQDTGILLHKSALSDYFLIKQKENITASDAVYHPVHWKSQVVLHPDGTHLFLQQRPSTTY